MFKEPEHLPSAITWWWIVAFATVMTLMDLWMRDYESVGFHATLTLLVAVQAATEGRPVGWLRVAQWSLAALMAALLVLRMTRWAS
jgi:hypothetical protein